jgi:tripartite-type tricarboxylate transporter receptor subunit TctC
MKIHRLPAVLLLIVGLLGTGAFIILAPASGTAQTYPARPIEVIVPFAPGGSTEIATRVLIASMSETLGQTMVLVTKPGSGGAIGADFVAKAKADGYTILSSSASANAVGPAINLNTPYSINDFVPLGRYGTINVLLFVSTAGKWKTAGELFEYAKANPGKLTYGTGGVGATTFMFCELIKKVVGFKADHVPFKGETLAMTALAGGHIDYGSSALVGAQSQLDAKKIRALAVSGPKREVQLPEVPTIAEIGYPGASLLPWNGLFVPKATPKPIVDKLSHALRKAVETPSVRSALEKMGFAPNYLSGDELQKVIAQDFKTFRQLAEEGGFLVK